LLLLVPLLMFQPHSPESLCKIDSSRGNQRVYLPQLQWVPQPLLVLRRIMLRCRLIASAQRLQLPDQSSVHETGSATFQNPAAR